MTITSRVSRSVRKPASESRVSPRRVQSVLHRPPSWRDDRYYTQAADFVNSFAPFYWGGGGSLIFLSVFRCLSQVHLLGVQRHLTCFAELMQTKLFISWPVCSRLPVQISHLGLSRNPPDLQIPPRGGALSCLVEEVLLQHDHHEVRALPLRRLPRQLQPLRRPGLLQGVLQPAEMSAPPERHRLVFVAGRFLNLCFFVCLLTALPMLCLDPLDKGKCSASFPRYYYNAATKKCEEFTYSGCGGSSNNFVSRQSCLDVCARGV